MNRRIPPFPRHLSEEGQEVFMKQAADAIVERALAFSAKELGVSVEQVRKNVGNIGVFTVEKDAQTQVLMQWAFERIAALEAEVKAGHDRLKRLEAGQ